MKAFLISTTVLIVLVCSSFFIATAKAETVKSIADQTRQVLRKRLNFIGHPEVQIQSVRCQTNGYQSWFCIVWENSYATGRFDLDYIVTVSGQNLHWSLQN